MQKKSKILVIGDRSLIGATLLKVLKSRGFSSVFSESLNGIKLLSQNSLNQFFKKSKPEYVFLTHLKSGGIVANINYPAEFMYDNLEIQNNIIHASYLYKIKKLLFLGSSCIYPQASPQPISEDYLLSAELEKTNEPYSIAKIAGIKMCQSYNRQYRTNFISVIPATIYGPGDHFDTKTGHVISSLIKKFHEAKLKREPKVSVWGTGKPRREFIYAEDVVNACIFLMDKYDNTEIINVGCGQEISIAELSKFIKEIVGFKGGMMFDGSKPDGVAQKLLDDTKIRKLGWQVKTPLKRGLELTYNWYKRYYHRLEEGE